MLFMTHCAKPKQVSGAHSRAPWQLHIPACTRAPVRKPSRQGTLAQQFLHGPRVAHVLVIALLHGGRCRSGLGVGISVRASKTPSEARQRQSRHPVFMAQTGAAFYSLAKTMGSGEIDQSIHAPCGGRRRQAQRSQSNSTATSPALACMIVLRQQGIRAAHCSSVCTSISPSSPSASAAAARGARRARPGASCRKSRSRRASPGASRRRSASRPRRASLSRPRSRRASAPRGSRRRSPSRSRRSSLSRARRASAGRSRSGGAAAARRELEAV